MGEFHPYSNRLSRQCYDQVFEYGRLLARPGLIHTQHEPILRIFAIEQEYPKKFNLPDAQYEAYYQKPKPNRIYSHTRMILSADGGKSSPRRRPGCSTRPTCRSSTTRDWSRTPLKTVPSSGRPCKRRTGRLSRRRLFSGKLPARRHPRRRMTAVQHVSSLSFDRLPHPVPSLENSRFAVFELWSHR